MYIYLIYINIKYLLIILRFNRVNVGLDNNIKIKKFVIYIYIYTSKFIIYYFIIIMGNTMFKLHYNLMKIYYL